MGADHEDPEAYKPGGLHPVHLGDKFSNDRYTVVHKLGHGATSTVWLVSDAQTNAYASLKLLSASKTATELPVLQHLRSSYDPAKPGSQHVAQILDHFVHEGPNGRHQCLVGEVFGPNFSVSNTEWLHDLWDDGRLPSEIVHRICGQLAVAVAYLHKRGVAHGDLNPGNVLLSLPRSWTSKADLDAMYGDARLWTRDLPSDGKKQPGSAQRPKYLVVGLNTNPELLRVCLQEPNIKLCDFSESYIPSLPDPPRVATPHFCRPPEALLAVCPHATPELDIWALGVMFFYLISGAALFLDHRGDDGQLQQMVLWLGPFPEPLWSKWEKRVEFFDEAGTPLDSQRIRNTRYSLLFAVDYALPPNSPQRELFEALLRRMVCYDVPSRIHAEGVVESTWFKEHCEPNMGYGDKYVVEWMHDI
ncbi:Protein kinase [Mycena kentingensis (nom. inval.)]|nr:Protein kinase [Mycena kentingensis (nom. inval.)]